MLNKLQNYFQGYILSNNIDLSNKNPLQPIVEYISDNKNNPLDPLSRLNIYRDSFYQLLTQTIANDYPKLKMLLQPQKFNPIAKAFIEHHTPNKISLKHYADLFKNFFKQNYKKIDNKISEHKFSLLCEMAEFEHALSSTQNQPIVPSLNNPIWNNFPHEKLPYMKIKFHPSIRIFTSHWNVHHVWEALDKNPNLIHNQNVIQNIIFNKEPETTNIIIWMCDLKVQFQALSMIEAEAFKICFQGKFFSELCAMLMDFLKEDEIPVFALNCIQQWKDNQLIIGLRFE